MNKQDNPHAKGLSVNEDIVIEEWTEEAGIHIKVDLSPARERLHRQIDCLESLKADPKFDAAEWQADIDVGRVTLIYKGENPIEIKDHDCCHEPIVTILDMVTKESNHRSGLALTNPEE